MRRLLPLLLALSFVGCTELVYPPETNLHVYNSAWEKVAEATVRADVSVRGVDSALTLEEFVAEYNATHTDDQLFLVEGEEVPVEAAPDAPAWIVNAISLEVYWSDTVERADLALRRDAWRMSVEVMADPDTGALVDCTLYVDNIPPAPPVIEPPQPRLWVALVNYTTLEIFWSERYDTEAAAITRYRALVTQAELNEAGLGMGPGDWGAYIGAVEFAW